jgi:hypothetical protein
MPKALTSALFYRDYWVVMMQWLPISTRLINVFWLNTMLNLFGY